MFTGIITDQGTVKEISPIENGLRMRIRTSYLLDTVELGASIAHDGACLTVIAKGDDWYDVDISPETLAKTTLGHWQLDTTVNLERPVVAGGEFGGHFVTGHVDALGEVLRFESQGDFWLLEIRFPESMKGYIADKGSVAINGVSLTVNSVTDSTMQLMIIPHTADHTNIGRVKPGTEVNLEIDLVARYVASLLQQQSKGLS